MYWESRVVLDRYTYYLLHYHVSTAFVRLIYHVERFRIEAYQQRDQSVIVTIRRHYFSVDELKTYRSIIIRTDRIVHLLLMGIIILFSD